MHVVIDNPGIDHCLTEGPPGSNEWVSWMPHGDRVLIGGVSIEDRPEPGIDLDTGNCLLAAACSANGLLATARIAGYNSGIRPTRPTVRVEEDDRFPAGGRLIHNYGHGGLGVTLSWGCVDNVAALVNEQETDMQGAQT